MITVKDKINRRISRHVDRSILPIPHQTIVSFGFDDCPASAIETALPMLEAEGWRATIYVACGLCETENHLGVHMCQNQIIDVHKRGHEFADHTFSHISANSTSVRDYMADVARNQSTLKALGLPPSRHFAFPYGDVSPAQKRALRRRFKTLRGVVSPSSNRQDANLLNAMRLYSGPSIQAALAQIDAARTQPQWLNFFTHDVRETPSAYGCTPDEFRTVVAAVREAGLRVMTVDAAYRTIRKSRT